MSKSKHMEAQIIAALKAGGGRPEREEVAGNGVSKHTIYAWKAKYGGWK